MYVHPSAVFLSSWWNRKEFRLHSGRKIFIAWKIFYFIEEGVDVEELRAALSIIRQKRHNQSQISRPDFLDQLDEENKGTRLEW